MAVNVVDLLIREMKYPAMHKEHLLLEQKLIVRKSTAPLSKEATASTNKLNTIKNIAVNKKSS